MSQSVVQNSPTSLVRQMNVALSDSDKTNLYEAANYPGNPSPIVLLPVLTSTVVDELLSSFGFSPNSRPHLIKQGLFPKGVALRSRAMSTSLYPALAVDLIALLASNTSVRGSHGAKLTLELALRLKDEITELTTLDLFSEVVASLAHRLPAGQPFTLAAITRLFRPAWPTTLKLGDFPTVEAFGEFDYPTWEKWYTLARFQHLFRQSFFDPPPPTGGSSSQRATGLKPVTNITLGVVEGEVAANPGNSRAVLTYTDDEGPMAFEEEVELPVTLLARLGCDWLDAPLARLEAKRDAYYTHLVFYLPGLHNPASLQKLDRTTQFLAKNTTNPFGTIEGFERPWDENTLGELLAELSDGEGQVVN